MSEMTVRSCPSSMTAMGLGCVKTRMRRDGLEQDSAVTGSRVPCANYLLPALPADCFKCQQSGAFGPPRVFLRLPSLSNERRACRSFRRWLELHSNDF